MFSFFETLLDPTKPPARPEPPPQLAAFYWHYARQVKSLFVALFAAGFVVATLDSMVPVFMGRVVSLVTSSDPARLWEEAGWTLVGMAAVLLVARPLALVIRDLVSNQAISANVANMMRWQHHWHVVRQSWTFFQNDYAGRIAARVLQTGPAIRESLVAVITGVWYIIVYGANALIVLASADADHAVHP
jgi:ATP-binding cassette subfamily B multidrug efflux pump